MFQFHPETTTKRECLAGNMSAIWQDFTLDIPTSKTATSLVREDVILRSGTSVANFNTSNLIKHLKTQSL